MPVVKMTDEDRKRAEELLSLNSNAPIPQTPITKQALTSNEVAPAPIKDPAALEQFSKDFIDTYPLESSESINQSIMDEKQAQMRGLIDSELDNNRSILAKQSADQISMLERDEADRQKAMNMQLSLQNEMNGLQGQLIENNKKQIDPNRFWNQSSTWNKVLAGISIALGGLGSGATGGVNRAFEIINGAVADDIKAQEANISNDYKNISGRAALTQLKLKSVGDYLSSLSQKTQDALTSAKLEQLNTLVETQQAATEKQRQISAALKEGRDIEISMLPEAEQKRAVRFSDNSIGVLTNEKDKPKVIDALRDTANFNRNANILITLLEKAKNNPVDAVLISTPLSESGSLANSALQSIIGSLNKQILGGGPIRLEEREILKTMLGNIEKMFKNPATSLHTIKNFKRILKDSTRDFLHIVVRDGKERFEDPNRERIGKLIKSGRAISPIEAEEKMKTTYKGAYAWRSDPMDKILGE